MMKFPQVEMSIFVRRHKTDGSMMVVPCVMSQLTKDDADDAVQLHNEVVHGLGDEIFIPEPEDVIKRYFTDDGLSVGIKYDGRLICLRTLTIDSGWSRHMLEGMNLPSDEAKDAVCTGFCVVDKEFRGNNVQLLSEYYAENIIAANFKKIFTVVAPHNVFSLQNVFNCNYRIIGINKIYDKYFRYVLKKELQLDTPLWTHWHLQIPLRDIERQRKAIAAGAVGYKLVRKPSGMHILYATTGNFPHWAKDLHID